MSIDVIPVSVRLQSNLKIPRGYYIIKRAERQLLNEKIRTINNTLEIYEHQRDTCIDHLTRVLDKTMMEEWKEFIDRVREARHKKTLECQMAKYERLCEKRGGHSNHDHYSCHGHTKFDPSKDVSIIGQNTTTATSTTTNKWVKNLSSIPLTKAKEHLLSHGPNFAIAPKCLPNGEYITMVEQTCQKTYPGGGR